MQNEANFDETGQQEALDASTDPAARKRAWRLRINYRFIVQHTPYILFLSGLALLYIANTHLTEKKIWRINKLDKEIKELKWEYISLKSELMFNSKVSEVSQKVSDQGLKPLNTPPQKIEVEKK
ncbi:MAG TPA: FtsL-like putative cell division protein [Chitinophaga sp.]